MKLVAFKQEGPKDTDLAWSLYRATPIFGSSPLTFDRRRELTGGTYRGTTTTFMHAHMIREELSDESRMRWRMPSIESITGSPVQEF